LGAKAKPSPVGTGAGVAEERNFIGETKRIFAKS
jgi:hypothetical protein